MTFGLMLSLWWSFRGEDRLLTHTQVYSLKRRRQVRFVEPEFTNLRSETVSYILKSHILHFKKHLNLASCSFRGNYLFVFPLSGPKILIPFALANAKLHSFIPVCALKAFHLSLAV